MTVTIYDVGNAYRFVVQLTEDPEDTLTLEWGKEPPEGQTLEQYLANCKREAELLGQLELAKRQPPQEIAI